MSVERIIGVDFGTTTSVIRVKRYDNGHPLDGRESKQEVIFNGDRPMVPTLIQRTDKGTYYGYDAMVSQKGQTLFRNFKVDLENPDPVRRQEARTLTEEFFVYMAKEDRSQSEGGHFGDTGDMEHTIVSYPVKWSDETKSFIVRAAEKAGFKNVEGMDEAQAAIHAVTIMCEDYLIKYDFFTVGVPCNILLIDMGAGTTDLALCCYTPGSLPKNKIICTWPKAGDIFFGGREVDEILREYIRSLLPANQADSVLKINGIEEFKTWKETRVSPALARHETVTEFTSIDRIVDILDIDMEPYELDRSRFEKLAEKYLEGFPRLIADCIENSKISKEDIDLVILTGGHSQWYFVKEMLTNNTKVDLPKIRQNSDRVVPITRPHETVALGMIYRPLSVQFQPEPDMEEERKKRIVEYYRKNMGSLIYFPKDRDVMIVKPDGTIGYKGEYYKDVVANWRDIVCISGAPCGINEYDHHIVGIRRNGTVVAIGDNRYSQRNVQGWKDIVSISCGSCYTIGLRKDRTAVAIGNNECGQCNVQGWKDIVSISCGVSHTIGLRKDGTAVATGINGEGECNVQGWKDIVSISCGYYHTIGLRKDGTAVATGINGAGECNVQGWKDIVSISCGELYTIGLRKDGTMVATGSSSCGQCDVQNWRDIIAIYAGRCRTLGVRRDGTIIYTDYMSPQTFFERNFGRYPLGSKIFCKEIWNSYLYRDGKTRYPLGLGTKTLPWKLF